MVRFVYIPVRRCKSVSNRSVLLTYQHGPGRSNWSLEWVNFFSVLSSRFIRYLSWFNLLMVPARTSLQRLKDEVLFRYQLWRLFHALSWSVSLMYQLVRRYDVSNWAVWTTYQWNVTKTSQIGPSHSRISRNVVMTSQQVPRRLNLQET